MVDQIAYYHSNEVVDRNGRAVPVGLDADVLTNGLAASVSLELPRIASGARRGICVLCSDGVV
ncbi:MAG TPA: hypothetical protein VK762_06390 [Polyangiaceae bacterium]|nr:hypothetical protein [Polyangiaceae bacterium]